MKDRAQKIAAGLLAVLAMAGGRELDGHVHTPPTAAGRGMHGSDRRRLLHSRFVDTMSRRLAQRRPRGDRPMTDETYMQLADEYRRRHHEPLVADAEWCAPLYDACTIAVECDPAAGHPAYDMTADAIARTADVIAVITYGRAAIIRPAIAHVQRMHDDAAEYFDTYDRPGEWLDAEGSWKDWESEAEGAAAEAKRDALSSALDVLQTIAHGMEPEQGKAPDPGKET